MMAEALIALQALAAMMAVSVFWAVVIFVIPAYLALVVASWFPLTGQWRKRWAERRSAERTRVLPHSHMARREDPDTPPDVVLRRPRETEEAEFLRAHHATSPQNPNFLHYYEEGMAFRRYLEILDEQERGVNLPPRHVPTTFLFAFVGDRIVGRVTIRLMLNEHLERNGGHIGYVIAPEFRRQGYATRMLASSLRVAREQFGLSRVLLTVDDDNVGSIKVVEKNGGVFDRMVDQAGEERPKRRYWIETGRDI